MKEVLFSLGVLLGFVSGYKEPEIIALLFRDERQLFLSASIENSNHRKIHELVESGNPLEIKLTILLKDYDTKIFTHKIIYQPIKKIFEIYHSESKKNYQTNNAVAAFLLWTEFSHLRLWTSQELKDKILSIIIYADLALAEPGEADPKILWNYSNPQKIIYYNSIEEVSY